jgi:hypothetical protein
VRVVGSTIQIYDISVDNWRELTPSDVEQFENVTAAYGLLRSELKALLENSKLVAQGKADLGDIYKLRVAQVADSKGVKEQECVNA